MKNHENEQVKIEIQFDMVGRCVVDDEGVTQCIPKFGSVCTAAASSADCE